MVILAHSSAALFAAPLASRLAGSLILLGSYLFPSSDYHASLREFSRYDLWKFLVHTHTSKASHCSAAMSTV